MSVELIIFSITTFLLFLSIHLHKKIFRDKKRRCNFKISKPKISKCPKSGKYFANFKINVFNENNISKIFFTDFPILFKFYSDTRFKSKIKITYKTVKTDSPTKLIDKLIIFETETKECIKHINDIIIGQIFIRIEVHPEYGNPIIEFEILENNFCELNKEYKTIIKF